jgi:beta-N-acetylhexosaminidase
MICCRCTGVFYNSRDEYIRDLMQLASEEKVGGFILFAGDVYETAYLINSLQNKADTPLLIASDLERGLGNQIEGATLFPPLMSIGAADSEELAYKMGKITAVEARAIGIHMTYAPVVDVNINPDNPIINVRSLGEDPERVGELAAAFIKGCQENGLIATAKHFPGHGDTDLDSHSVLPIIAGDRQRLEQVELYPFKKAIEAGVKAVMTAHLRVPALDPAADMPATLSETIMTGLLREELGFKGLIVTDAMDMGGIVNLYSQEEAAVMAVNAGVDMVLIPPEPRKVIRALKEAVEQGQIPEERINTSVGRILNAKASLGLHRKPLVDIDALDKIIGAPASKQAAEEAFVRSITLIKNEEDVLPLEDRGKKIMVFSLSSDPGGYFAGQTFVNEVKSRCLNASEFYADAFTGKEYLLEGFLAACEADVILIALFSRLRAWKGSVGLNEEHIRLIKYLASGPIPIVVVSFGSPYFYNQFPEVTAYMCAYRHADQAQIAAVKAIFGESDVNGKLPVSLPGYFPLGYGLKLIKIFEDKLP